MSRCSHFILGCCHLSEIFQSETCGVFGPGPLPRMNRFMAFQVGPKFLDTLRSDQGEHFFSPRRFILKSGRKARLTLGVEVNIPDGEGLVPGRGRAEAHVLLSTLRAAVREL